MSLSSLASKLLSDMAKFDKLMQALKREDVDGHGFVDKETFVDHILMQVRMVTPQDLPWALQSLSSQGDHVVFVLPTTAAKASAITGGDQSAVPSAHRPEQTDRLQGTASGPPRGPVQR
jgi:hypothetical protein